MQPFLKHFFVTRKQQEKITKLISLAPQINMGESSELLEKCQKDDRVFTS